jgi:putative ABC transport system permease protein
VGGLTSLAFRSLRARPGRTATSIVGIALGVGVLFASIATDTGIDASIDRTVRDLVGRADLRVAAFQDRGLSPETVAVIAAAPGVVVAAPVLERRTYLEADPRDPGTGDLAAPVTILALDPELDAEVRELPLVAGDPLAGPEAFAVLITERLAADDGLRIGGDVTIPVGTEGPVSLDIAGIIEGDGPFVGSSGRTVVAPLRTIQRLFGDDSVSRVDIVVGEGATPAEVEDALVLELTNEPYVLSSPRDLASSLRVSTADFRSTTALIAAVALFVGAFLIFNTLSMTVTERVRELGLLRAAGATRQQAGRFVLVQAVVLGLAGVLLGLAVGFGLSELMAAWVRSIGSIPFERVGITGPSAGLAVGIGLAVTLAASVEPARRAGSISPVEALKSRLEPVAARRARLRWLVGVFVAVGVAGLFFWPREGGTAGFLRALAVYALLLGVVLISPLLLGLLSRIAGLPFAAVMRLEERLARSALARDRSRTALTVGALTIGLAMIVAIGGVAGQSRSAAGEWLADVIPGDELVTSIRPIDLSEEASTIETLAGIDGVERVSPIATFEVAHEGVRTDAAAVVGDDLLADGRLRLVDGERSRALPALDDGGAAILPRAMAERLGLGVGQTLTLALGGERVLDLRIVGVAERTLPGRAGEAILVGWSDATGALGVDGAEAFAIRYAPGREADARPELEAAARLLALEPNPIERIAGAVDAALGRVFGLFDALAIVAVVVAGLGIVNTLTMNVLERVREIGVLRAAGMTTSQVRRTVVVEAGILGVAGTILGIATGLAAGAIVVLMSGGRPVLETAVPWGSIGLASVLGIGLSMLAAWYPARLASRLAIVRAVQHE